VNTVPAGVVVINTKTVIKMETKGKGGGGGEGRPTKYLNEDIGGLGHPGSENQRDG